jgi:hypothetical protein
MDKRIRERDDQGRLIASGFEWDETRPPVIFLRNAAALVGFVGAVAAVAMLFGVRHPDSVYGIFLAVICLPAAYLLHEYRFSRHGIIFHESGAIEAPYGMPAPHFLRKLVPAFVADVHSLDAVYCPEYSTQTSRLHVVVLYTTHGDTIPLTSRDYTHELARKVVAELTNALEELRAPRFASVY